MSMSRRPFIIAHHVHTDANIIHFRREDTGSTMSLLESTITEAPVISWMARYICLNRYSPFFAVKGLARRPWGNHLGNISYPIDLPLSVAFESLVVRFHMDTPQYRAPEATPVQ